MATSPPGHCRPASSPASGAITGSLLLCACLLLQPSSATADDPPSDEDPRVQWLADHAVRLRSVDPDDLDFEDLEPLRDLLAGVEVILLGEQSHGDGSTFLAKGRLVRFLHREMGFDVLAFESGLYDCAKAWQLIRAGEEPLEAIRQGVFAIWTRSAQVRPTLDYVAAQAASDRPLELAGFDSQFTGEASRKYFVADLTRFASALDLPFLGTEAWRTARELIERMAHGDFEGGGTPPPPVATQRAFRQAIATLGRQIAGRAEPGDREAALWQQVLVSLSANSRTIWDVDPENPAADPGAFEQRDLQMGANLVWLARERFAGRKIIVWAATFHNARNLGTIEAAAPSTLELYREIDVMGDVVARELGERAYSLGFVAYDGDRGSVFGRPRPLPPPDRGALEDLFHRAGLVNALVDFRRPAAGGAWLRRPITSRPLGYSPMRARWGRIVDGMLFTRTMVASSRADHRGDGASR